MYYNKQESLKREGVPVELTELPNIGPVLAENLRRVDINSAEELRAAGACEAWLRIRTQVDPGA